MTPRVTISLPVYMRPERTQRVIKALLNQTVKEWEAWIIGDACPHFHEHKDLLKDPRIKAFNYLLNNGGFGYKQTNHAIDYALGKYFVFLANDDTIAINHLENYLCEIEGTDLDFVYFDSFVLGKRRNYKLKFGRVGHNALIVRTDYLKQMPPHGPEHGHDWKLIETMMLCGAKYKKSKVMATYMIMSSTENGRVDLEGLD